MFLARNKAKRLLLVNHITKTIHHHHHYRKNEYSHITQSFKKSLIQATLGKWLGICLRSKSEGDSGVGGVHRGRAITWQSLWRTTNWWNDEQIIKIINNAPLKYAYPNTIKTCLTPNHLLFGTQLLYSSNITATVVRNITVLPSITDKINRISNHFLDKRRHKFTWDTTNIKIKYRLPKY